MYLWIYFLTSLFTYCFPHTYLCILYMCSQVGNCFSLAQTMHPNHFLHFLDCSLLADQSAAVPGKADQCSPEILNRSMAHVVCHNSKKGGALKQGAKPVISRTWSNHKYSSSDAIAQWTHCRFVCLYITASRNTFGMQDLLDTLNIPFNLSNPRCFPFISLTCPQENCLILLGFLFWGTGYKCSGQAESFGLRTSITRQHWWINEILMRYLTMAILSSVGGCPLTWCFEWKHGATFKPTVMELNLQNLFGYKAI